jgi:hypothetical protein
MLTFAAVEDEVEIKPQHDDHPVYVPLLKADLSVGHCITVNVNDTNEMLKGRLVRSNLENPARVAWCCYLPLFPEEITH